MEREKVSVIVPCYNEEESITIFYPEIKKVLDGMDYEYEILLVDDGSMDDTLKEIKNIASCDKHVKYLSFSKKFGKEAAMYAGFCNVDGDYVVVMDADMQDPPELIPEMMEILKEKGYDSVATRRVDRKGEPPVRSLFARLFYKVINQLSDVDIVDGARDYRLMKRNMVDAIVAMNENNRFSKGILGWIGFKTYWLSYENVKRVAGETKWNFWKLSKYALDGILSFSEAPLNFSSWLGIFITALSFFFLLFVIIRKIMCGDPVDGWASQVCIMLFIGGVQLFSIGIMGQYLSKIYVETKRRPHFIVSDTNKDDVKKIG